MMALSALVLSICSDAFTSGRHVLDAFLDFGDLSEPLLVLASLATCGLYMLDISYWSGAVGRLARRLSCLAMVCLVCVLGISLARQMPYFPLALFVLLFPLAGLAIRITALRSHTVLEVRADEAAVAKPAERAIDHDMPLGELQAVSAKLDSIKRLESKIDALQDKLDTLRV